MGRLGLMQKGKKSPPPPSKLALRAVSRICREKAKEVVEGLTKVCMYISAQCSLALLPAAAAASSQAEEAFRLRLPTR